MMYSDPKVKLYVDGIFFYLLPSLVCIVLYCFTGYQLMKSKGNKKVRNRNLTIAFLLSNLIWIIVWIPQMYAASLTVFKQLSFAETMKQPFSYYIINRYRFLSYVSHSYANPILVLFISKRFQEPIKRLGIWGKIQSTYSGVASTAGSSGMRAGSLKAEQSTNTGGNSRNSEAKLKP
ncbi:uncharacterized protein LOC134848338 [Symsagittifera roscoffensis]|uniref:uncharacterized protein LOC134848338 n=1 Tax=Symsagittifera roscoffensis TaxID=84072 RepID=UPI00307B30C7